VLVLTASVSASTAGAEPGRPAAAARGEARVEPAQPPAVGRRGVGAPRPPCLPPADGPAAAGAALSGKPLARLTRRCSAYAATCFVRLARDMRTVRGSTHVRGVPGAATARVLARLPDHATPHLHDCRSWHRNFDSGTPNPEPRSVSILNSQVRLYHIMRPYVIPSAAQSQSCVSNADHWLWW